MEENASIDIVDNSKKQLFGHPIGLFYLFAAEFWERFSYYGMRALLVLYIVDEFFLDTEKDERTALAYGVYGAYGALVYATPVLGGIIADKYLGYRKSIILGGVLMALGHFFMALPGEMFFYWALGLLVVGNGFFKPNISALVSTLYEEGDPRRTGGFTIFYMGVNLGAFFSPLVCGWLGMEYGWHYGFGAAGIGMLGGLALFMYGIKQGILGDRGYQPKKMEGVKVAGLTVDRVIYAVAFFFVPIVSLMIYSNEMDLAGMELMGAVLTGVLVVVLGKIIYHMAQEDKATAQRLGVIVMLTFFIMVFWSFFEQAGTSLTIFADENVNLPSWCNAAQTQSINPLFIIMFAIPFAAMWPMLAKKGMNPITPVKSFLGMLQLGIGFLIFAYAAHFVDDAGKVPFMFLVGGYFIMTLGELCISPVGLSKVTELAPAKIVGFMLGAFYLSSSFAHHIAGVIAKLTVPKEGVVPEGMLVDMADSITGWTHGQAPEGSEAIVQSLATSTTVFAQIGIVAVVFSLVILVLSPVIKKMMNGIH